MLIVVLLLMMLSNIVSLTFAIDNEVSSRGLLEQNTSTFDYCNDVVYIRSFNEEYTNNGIIYTFEIPISDESPELSVFSANESGMRNSNAIFRLEIYGSGGKVIGQAWRIGSIGTHNLKLTLKSGNTASSCNTEVSNTTTTNMPYWPIVIQTKSEAVTQTKFYSVTLSGTIDGQSYVFEGDGVIFNKNGSIYPNLKDKWGNVHMTMPSSALWTPVSNPLPALTTSERNAYISWYEATYNKGKALNWTNVQIHHIKPRQYGGTHIYSNLMPLDTSTHTTVNTWWQNYQ